MLFDPKRKVVYISEGKNYVREVREGLEKKNMKIIVGDKKVTVIVRNVKMDHSIPCEAFSVKVPKEYRLVVEPAHYFRIVRDFP